MRIRHLVVINVNDAYGNLYVEGMRNARDGYAPDMTIQQIPLDEGSGSIHGAVGAAKDTGYRFIFAIVFTADTHDQLMTAAYEQGIAGDGKHNWIFGDSFLGTLDNRSFEKNSPLHLSYRYATHIETDIVCHVYVLLTIYHLPPFFSPSHQWGRSLGNHGRGRWNSRVRQVCGQDATT